ncbi:Aste57867_14972 [Aphanomyces stellatus]|uniref:Aste57867_14972 protein n=1 Tax=Aphanomyces stellatus TaxID=120398 RepID=A0A485L2B4_9STRA|nr:hypothetical protein As57867_014916 [Aphanomyces stellatus]VFT91786.1 Aste57867_14972 [Aphanomyces stellatus]
MSDTSLTRIDQLIHASNRMLLPSALQSLSVDEILVQAPDLPALHAADVRAHGFDRLVKYLEAHDHAAFDPDEAGKWAAARYMALRTMMLECDRAKKTALHRDCVARVLDWFDTSGLEHQKARAIYRCSLLGGRGGVAGQSVAHQVAPEACPQPRGPRGRRLAPDRAARGIIPLSRGEMTRRRRQRYKHRDLRTSHIHRIAELRERGYVVASPRHVDRGDTSSGATPAHEGNQIEVNEQTERVKVGYQYHTPETDAEHELNQIWLMRRAEEAQTKAKHDEVSSVLYKWSICRSREEAEFLRKQESTRMMAHKQNPNLPLHVASVQDTNQDNDYSLDGGMSGASAAKPKHASAPVVIKKKPSATGMRYRNPLPPNYRPSMTTTAVDVAPSPNHPKSPSAMGRSTSAATLAETPTAKQMQAKDKYIPFTASYTSLIAPDAKQHQLQQLASKRKHGKKPGAMPHETSFDPEYKLFHEASTERRCQVGRPPAQPVDRASTPLMPSSSSSSQPPKVLTHSTSTAEFKPRTAHLPGTSSLRLQQMDELEDIRVAFQKHNLGFNVAVFERAMLIPEDKSIAECVKHMPVAGSKLLENPLLATKLKVMRGLDGTGKKKAKKGGGKKAKKGKGKKKKNSLSRTNSSASAYSCGGAMKATPPTNAVRLKTPLPPSSSSIKSASIDLFRGGGPSPPKSASPASSPRLPKAPLTQRPSTSPSSTPQQQQQQSVPRLLAAMMPDGMSSFQSPPTSSSPVKSPRAGRDLVSVGAWASDEVDMELLATTPTAASSAQIPSRHASFARRSPQPISPSRSFDDDDVEGDDDEVAAADDDDDDDDENGLLFADERPKEPETSSIPRKPPLVELTSSMHLAETAVPLTAMANVIQGKSQPPIPTDHLPTWECGPAIHVSKPSMDPELQIFHDSFMARRQTWSWQVKRFAERDARRATQGSIADPLVVAATKPKNTTYSSALRRQQMGEIDQIRQAFERHSLHFQDEVFERALLTPEDKPTFECVEHLPIAGSKLHDNPLLAQKRLLFKMPATAKKGKKKKKKGKAKKKKKQ